MYDTLDELKEYAETSDNIWLWAKLKKLEFEIELETSKKQ